MDLPAQCSNCSVRACTDKSPLGNPSSNSFKCIFRLKSTFVFKEGILVTLKQTVLLLNNRLGTSNIHHSPARVPS